MFRSLKRRRRRYLRVGSSEDAAQDDTKMYRCKVCGWPCNADTVAVGEKRENASSVLTGVSLETDDDGDIYPEVKRGCPQCGSLYSR